MEVAEHLVGKRSAIASGDRRLIVVEDVEIGVFRWNDAFYAYENRCLHQGGPACEGMLIGRVEAVLDGEQRLVTERFSTEEMHIVCPWHGWEYDLATGEFAPERRRRLRRFDVVERGDDVYVVV